jgi:hypothetical protein
MMTDSQSGDHDETETLRRLVRNAERLSRGPATPQHDAIEASFKRYQAATKGLSGIDDEQGGYETGTEDPVIEGWEPRNVCPGERAALIGRNFFGVRGLVIGGAEVDDLVVVNSRRLEFTVPLDTTSDEVVVVYAAPDYARRKPVMELGAPNIESPKAK